MLGNGEKLSAFLSHRDLAIELQFQMRIKFWRQKKNARTDIDFSRATATNHFMYEEQTTAYC